MQQNALCCQLTFRLPTSPLVVKAARIPSLGHGASSFSHVQQLARTCEALYIVATADAFAGNEDVRDGALACCGSKRVLDGAAVSPFVQFDDGVLGADRLQGTLGLGAERAIPGWTKRVCVCVCEKMDTEKVNIT